MNLNISLKLYSNNIIKFIILFLIIMLINFLNTITEHNYINSPLYTHNKYYNKYWSLNKTKIYPLIEIIYNKLLQIINNKLDIKYELININLINHRFPIIYEYYIENIKNISYNNFINNVNKRFIKNKYINYIPYISKYIIVENKYKSTIYSILNEFHNGYFISVDIKQYIEHNITRCLKYSFDILELYLFLNNDDNISNTLINNIYTISRFFYELNPIKKIIFYYFNTPIKKEIISNLNYLSSQNTNSGLTTNDYIIIWRKEELLKVYIHELIHYLNLDNKHNKKINNLFNYNIGKYNYPILINETLTEINAMFFHTLFTIIIDNNNTINNNFDYIIHTFKILYNIELMYSWFQFAKIMKFFNIQIYDNILIKKNFNQTTNIYSYYILKSIFNMYFIDILYESFSIQKLLNIKQTTNKLNIILKSILDNQPINLFNNFINKLSIDDLSLRMTIIN